MSPFPGLRNDAVTRSRPGSPSRRDPSLCWLRDLLHDLRPSGLVDDTSTQVATLHVSQAAVNVMQGRDRNSGVVSRHLSRLRAMGVICGTRPLQVDLVSLDRLDPVDRNTATTPRSEHERPALRLAVSSDEAAPSPTPWVDIPGPVDVERTPDTLAAQNLSADMLRTTSALACALTAALERGADDLARRLTALIEAVLQSPSGVTSHRHGLAAPIAGLVTERSGPLTASQDSSCDPRGFDERPARPARSDRASDKTPGREREKISLPPFTTPLVDTGRPRAESRAESRAAQRAAIRAGGRAEDHVAELCRDEHDLRALLAPLVEVAGRCGVVGITSLSGVELALRPYTDDQVRAAITLISRRVRLGEPIVSPFGLLIKKARERDPAYFPPPSPAATPAHTGDFVYDARVCYDDPAHLCDGDATGTFIDQDVLAARFRSLAAGLRPHTPTR